MKQKIVSLLIACSWMFFPILNAQDLSSFVGEYPLFVKSKDDCRGCRGHTGKRGSKGKMGKPGLPGINGCTGPQGAQGNQGARGAAFSIFRTCTCGFGNTSFTFRTRQNLSLSGQWQAYVILPDFTTLSGPLVNIEDPSTTFSINLTTPGSFVRGTYAIILKNISINGLNTQLLDSSLNDALVVASTCFYLPAPPLTSISVFYNSFDIPFSPGDAVIFYFGDPGCRLTA